LQDLGEAGRLGLVKAAGDGGDTAEDFRHDVRGGINDIIEDDREATPDIVGGDVAKDRGAFAVKLELNLDGVGEVRRVRNDRGAAEVFTAKGDTGLNEIDKVVDGLGLIHNAGTLVGAALHAEAENVAIGD